MLRGKLSNGICLPLISLGTYQIHGPEIVHHIIKCALQANYRSFDTAAGYKNEKDIGNALECLMKTFSLKREDIFLTSKLKFDCAIIHDFELTATRRPKIIMQTVGHISGAAKFYQRKDLGADDPWNKEDNIMGVCLHPVYGGWFAFRGVIILKNLLCRELLQQEPKSVISDNLELINLLRLFNEHWKDGRYRDFIPAKEQYSNLQKLYFDTKPSERVALLQNIMENHEGLH